MAPETAGVVDRAELTVRLPPADVAELRRIAAARDDGVTTAEGLAAMLVRTGVAQLRMTAS